MSSNLSLTAINSTNSAPYLTSDRTELAPLCSSHQDTKWLRIVISCMTAFTVLVSLALATQLHHGDYQVVAHGSVVSDNTECSAAGIALMKRGGSAVDAVISTLFCLSVVLPHLVGIGGGGYLMVYDQRQREVMACLDFQPAMGSHSIIGVPGFVAGLYQAHQEHGQLPWPEVLQAAIQVAGSGFSPSASLLSALPLAAGRPDLVDLLSSGRNPHLLDTLTDLALNGSDELYHGRLGAQLSELLSGEELAQYRVLSGACVEQTVGRHKVAVAGPGGRLLLQLLLKINLTEASHTPLLSVAASLRETMVESRRYSSGVNVVAADQNDIYVSAVSGLGSVLGSLDLTSGGYLLNNNNLFVPAHAATDGRSSTLSSPVIVTQADAACGNRFLTGASDVRDAAQLLVQLLPAIGSDSWLKAVSDAPRARITATGQLLLEKYHEPQLDSDQLTTLQAWNYTVASSPQPYPSLNIIHKIGDKVTSVADSRGGGSPATF